MSGRNEGVKIKAKSRSARAGIYFPIVSIQRRMRKNKLAERIFSDAPVYLATVLEYICAEILQLAGHVVEEENKSRITPRHLRLAMRNDEELKKLLSGSLISQDAVQKEVLPNAATAGSSD